MKLFVQKTIRLAIIFVFNEAVVFLKNVTSVQEKFVLSTTEFTIKSGHSSQFEEGKKPGLTVILKT